MREPAQRKPSDPIPARSSAAKGAVAALLVGLAAGYALTPAPLTWLLAMVAVAALWTGTGRVRRRGLDALYRAHRLAAWEHHCARERRRLHRAARRHVRRAATARLRPAPQPSRLWRLFRGGLAVVGAVTLLVLGSQAAVSVFGPPLRKLFGAHPTCHLGEAMAEAERDARRDRHRIDGHRNLKTFADTGDGVTVAGGTR